ncbi:MAG TPA: diacylglycerol kinase family protein [Desulfuromonadaceae bacterium]
MKPFLFINPLSGSYARKRVNTVLTRLKIAGLSPTVFSASTPAEISSYCRQINETDDAPLVIVAGGDGTFNAVVNGLRPGTATLAVLPLGTSNVLAAELGIKSVKAGIKRIVKGNTRPLSLGVLELEQESRRFILMAGIGLDGSVVRDVWPLGKRLLKQGAYALSAVVSAFRWDRSMIEVITADRQLECHSVIVCSASRYGGDFIIAPEGDVFSPELTAVCIRKNKRQSYVRLAYELFRGKADISSELVRIPADGLEIRGTKPIQIDGDFVGYSPARITTVHDFARIIV